MDEKYNGFTNYATWNVDLWITSANEMDYLCLVQWLHLQEQPVTGDMAKRFIVDHPWLIFSNEDLDAADWDLVDWDDLADTWESVRLDLDPPKLASLPGERPCRICAQIVPEARVIGLCDLCIYIVNKMETPKRLGMLRNIDQALAERTLQANGETFIFLIVEKLLKGLQ